MSAKQNVLITGGVGFIGAYLTREISKYQPLHPVIPADNCYKFLKGENSWRI
jgi:nucleoside-diphosphate-sugar epimerase